jgi:hypothetical protein
LLRKHCICLYKQTYYNLKEYDIFQIFKYYMLVKELREKNLQHIL